MSRAVALAIAAVLTSATALGDSAARLTIVVSGFETREGRALCKLFRRPTTFPSGGADATATGAIGDDAVARCVFDAIPLGTFAVAVAHDVNGSGTLGRNVLGFPKEPFGFSGGALSTALGPPSFARASFVLHGDLEVRIPLE